MWFGDYGMHLYGVYQWLPKSDVLDLQRLSEGGNIESVDFTHNRVVEAVDILPEANLGLFVLGILDTTDPHGCFVGEKETVRFLTGELVYLRSATQR